VSSSRELSWLVTAAFAVLVGCSLPAASQGFIADQDADGIPDALESALLNRYAPRLMISDADCDVAPASFRSGLPIPRVSARDNTLYGQVSPRESNSGVVAELHFYHLWERDCGRMGHQLDPEYVAALVRAESWRSPIGQWTAVYWYAAAHEQTVCDLSEARSAASLDAAAHGPVVWIAKDKHASFLSLESSRGGCGQDRFTDMREFAISAVVNIGEAGIPMNGAEWISSSRWPLQQKMRPVFLDDEIARALTMANPEPLPRGRRSRKQSVILAGGAGLDGIDTGRTHAENSVSLGAEKTDGAVKKSYRRVVHSLLRARKAVQHSLAWLPKTNSAEE
jgi:hypothetical protein